jgi:hypothetical protein
MIMMAMMMMMMMQMMMMMMMMMMMNGVCSTKPFEATVCSPQSLWPMTVA